MKTEKLYYTDAYLKEFSACVISSSKEGDHYTVILDKTAFFPEGGGQSSDKGYISDARVFDVQEKAGVIYHKTDRDIPVGTVVQCRVDFDARFEKMQMHTAEHLLCGILHKRLGAENTGFHLTSDGVTFDIDVKVSKDVLSEVERIANRMVYENRSVSAIFPDSDELSELCYRSKLELTDEVRIVSIDGVDMCACCAPHVSSTAQIGIIKITASESHRGGTRIYMLAGRLAYEYLSDIFGEAKELSECLSSPLGELATSCRRLLLQKSELEYKISKKNDEICRLLSENIKDGTKICVELLPVDSTEALMTFINLASPKCDTLVALFGEENDYRYVIKTKKEDVGPIVRSANVALCGKGGGRGDTAQGRFLCTLEDIKRYFLDL